MLLRDCYFAVVVTTGILSSVSAGLTALNMTASTNDWDTRTSGVGCAPDSCIASNAVDGSVEYESRWSCQSVDDDADACELTLDLGGSHDVEEIRLALWKGDQRTRLINVLADGHHMTTIESSGTTESYEPYQVTAAGVSTIVLQSEGTNDDFYNGWLSILEVEVMVESVVDVSSTTPAPTDPTYLGCFKDTLDDRVMSIVLTMDDLTSEVCSAACGEMYFPYYALQQGNECWCSACDLTDGELNTDYDRHGEGSCNTPCAGDPSSTCGGDMAFDLHLTGNCGPTPAPTVGGFESECPVGSTPYAVQVIFTRGDPELWVQFQVSEPGGDEVSNFSDLGEVGIVSKNEDETVYMYTSLNGLSIDTDPVLGDYTISIRGDDFTVPYTLTVLVAGEVVLDITNTTVFNEDPRSAVTEQEYFFTVTEYAESDCDVEDVECVEDTFSSDGTPPCTACSNGLISEEGSTTCDVAVFENMEIADDVAAAILADAVGGFAQGLYLQELSNQYRTIQDNRFDDDFFLVTAEDEGILQLIGTISKSSTIVVPESTALMVYVYSEETEELIVTQVDFEFSTTDDRSGTFTLTVDDLPAGRLMVYFSWSVLDPDYTPQYFGSGVYDVTVVNDACPSPLVITLEWDMSYLSSGYSSDDSWQIYAFELVIKEPDGNVVQVAEATDFGYLSSPAFGPAAMGYTVYGGNADVVGEYIARVYPSIFDVVPWTLTAEVNDEILWVEGGLWDGTQVTTTLGYSEWDEDDSPFPDFTVDLTSTTTC